MTCAFLFRLQNQNLVFSFLSLDYCEHMINDRTSTPVATVINVPNICRHQRPGTAYCCGLSVRERARCTDTSPGPCSAQVRLVPHLTTQVTNRRASSLLAEHMWPIRKFRQQTSWLTTTLFLIKYHDFNVEMGHDRMMHFKILQNFYQNIQDQKSIP